MLGECLDIKFTRQGFENACGIVRLAEQFNMHSRSQAGKLDVKRRKPGILFISLQGGSLFKLAIMT